MKRILVSAGDPSGDRYAAAFVREAKERWSDWEFSGLGGPRLAGSGAAMLAAATSDSVMGLAEVVGKLPRHASVFHKIRRKLLGGNFDLVVLVDYPDFNLRLAAVAKKAGVPVLYYVAPQLWAWRAGRAASIRRTVTKMAVIFPFEADYFGRLGIPTVWVGHPLLDEPSLQDRGAARRELGIPPDRTLVALFPGSRPHEVKRMWPLFRETAEIIRAAHPEAMFAVGADVAAPEGFLLPDCRSGVASMLAASDVALTKSGTISLQTALAGVPTVIGHRMHRLSYAIASRMVRTSMVGMANILLDDRVIPEFVQRAARPGDLANAVIDLLPGASAARARQLESFARLRTLLGTPGAAGRLADLAHGLLSG